MRLPLLRQPRKRSELRATSFELRAFLCALCETSACSALKNFASIARKASRKVRKAITRPLEARSSQLVARSGTHLKLYNRVFK
jgi:hypothetical protein